MMEEHELGGKLLSGVSRSFYLTLKALPEGLREPLSLAYLLARAADTLADTLKIPERLRLECLTQFESVLHASPRQPDLEMSLAQILRTEFVPLQEDQDEAMLLQRLPEALDAFASSPAGQKTAIQGVLKPIIHGQKLDIERFPLDGKLRALKTTGELDQYTYLVAGCVGEFWTKLCIQEAGDTLSAGVDLPLLLERGIRYGKGLQLINILRDIGKDRKLGRCYFPEEELQAHGLTVEDVQAHPERLLPVIQPWIRRCREHLVCGMEYLDSLQNKRIRFASALPLLIGLKTLALIRNANWAELEKGIKVSRTDVSKVAFEAGIASIRSGGLRKMAEKILATIPST